MTVITAGEGAGLDPMFEGIQKRYKDAQVDPPEVVYVDRDCCGPNYIGKKFPSWSATQVRLDIRHFMRRMSSACTTESHALYPQFMRRLSGCIFMQWSKEDLATLKEAKETQANREGVTFQGKEQELLTKKELALHCRRTTRSPESMRQLIEELLEVFSGEQGRDMIGTPLLDKDKARDVWESQKRHLECIKDPPNVSLYTQTGTLKKGSNMLPTFRCARGSTSLESFHLHLNRFIPGTSASDVKYQAFISEGLYRWNQDRACQAVEAPLSHTYDGLLRYAVIHLAQTVLGNPLDLTFKEPRAYTGELIGVEYLYSQTGKALQVVPEELQVEDTAEEDGEDHDEGFEEEEAEEDPTIPDAEIHDAAIQSIRQSLTSSARSSSSPKFVRQLPTVETTERFPFQGLTAQTEPLHMEEETGETPQEPSSGMQQVHDLADFLVQLGESRTLSRGQQDHLISLWDKLDPLDQRPAVFQTRTQSPPRARFMSSKTAKSPTKANVEKTKRSFVGTGTGPASYPDANRYMEEVVKRLMEVYTGPSSCQNAPTISRWSLILNTYNRVRVVVTEDP